MKTMSIDFVRQVIEQTLAEQHDKNPNLFGGQNQVNLMSFYEQLVEDYEVDRFTELYRDLVDQQNRTGLIMNGTIVAPENPTITNINQCLIVPLSFTCSFRVMVKDRDGAIETIDNLIQQLKGRKQDIAEIENGKLLKVGTIANNVDGKPRFESGDFIGEVADMMDLDGEILSRLGAYATLFSNDVSFNGTYYYFEFGGRIYRTYLDDEDTWVLDESFEYSGKQFDKYKLSLSFDSIRIDEPRNLNAEETCVISFSGSATLVSENVVFGNELTKLSFAKYKIVGDTDITVNGDKEWLEPLELPSGNTANTQVNQLLSNKFLNNTHTNSLNITNQYTFIVNKKVNLVKEWFDYARYGTQADLTQISSNKKGITPNLIYKVQEIWSCWGDVEIKEFKAKIIETIEIENTESDTLTITIPLQLQGDNY